MRIKPKDKLRRIYENLQSLISYYKVLAGEKRHQWKNLRGCCNF